MKSIICISGKAEHGKDFTASLLQLELSQRGERVVTMHYADLLKHICRSYFDWDGNKDEDGRRTLQHVGTDVIRTQEPNYWVNFLMRLIELFKDDWDYVIIPDCRFPNEIDGPREHFPTYHIRVHRPGHVSKLTPEQQNHISETALDEYSNVDWLVQNTSIERTERRIREIAALI